MKQHLKHVIYLLCGLVLMLGLMACGGKNSDSESTPGSDSGKNPGNNPGTEASEAPLLDGKGYTDEYDAGALFHFGMVPAKCENGKSGYVNQNGDWVIEPQFDGAYPFSSNGLAFAGVRKRIYGVIDRDGNFVSDIELTQENLTTPFSETGVKSVLVQGEDGVYPAVLSWKDGELSVLPWDDSVGKLGDFTASGYALVYDEGGSSRGQAFGIVDSSLNYTLEMQERFLIETPIYGPENHMVVYDNELDTRCVIDVQGNILYQMDPTIVPSFADNGRADVAGYGIIDETGALIVAEEEYFTPTGLLSAPDVELPFQLSDWIAFTARREDNYQYPIQLSYWNAQGENVLNCSKGRAMKNGLAAVYLEVKNTGGSGDTISVDEEGNAYIAGTQDGKAWVVINENLEIQYFLKDKGIDELETAYYSDGYAIVMVKDREADAEYNYIVDSQGNRLFERDKNPSLPIKSISNKDQQFTGHW